MAACGRNELLPAHPDLPLDLFTACLTTPIKAALHWYVSQKNLCQLVPGLTIDLLEKIPGQISDRRTMMGELNWIFTAITDTIAWNVLDSELFQKLFRQDLLVASLFRNFLLAERIIKSLDCTPVSHPALPPTHEHPLWQSWDLALDMCISQLPYILNGSQPPRDFVSCGFFTEQIEIFDVWLRYNVNSHTPPEQLPVVLQVLLSQQHRLKALELLGKFLDFGPWAVSSALSVGIFPYVLKLLTTQPKELRPLLTFIWAKILAVDKSCQAELVKDNGHAYFIQVLTEQEVEPTHKVYSIFVLSCLVDNYPSGKESAKLNHLIALCTYLLADKASKDFKNALLRQWCCLCLGLCWQNYPDAKWEGVRNNAHQPLIELIGDPVPEVRAAAIFALGTYIGCGLGTEGSQEQANKLDAEIVNALIKDYDIVFVVRKELLAALFNYVNQFLLVPTGQESGEVKVMTKSLSSSAISNTNQAGQLTNRFNPIPEQPMTTGHKLAHSTSINSPITTSEGPVKTTRTRGISQTLHVSTGPSPTSVMSNSNKAVHALFTRVWTLLVDMQSDPYPDVAQFARKVVNYFVTRSQQFDSLKRQTVLGMSGGQLDRRFSTDLTNKTNNTSNKLLVESSSQSSPATDTMSTEFVAWCCKYFLKPLLPTQPNTQIEELLINRPVDIYTAEFLDQHCKLLYNHKVKRRVPAEWHEPQYMDEILQIKHSSYPTHCRFHPYDDMLFVADADSVINVYDTQFKAVQQNQPKLSFANVSGTAKAKSLLTSFQVINAQHEPMLLTGTDDRIVRLFKPDLMSFKSNQLVTAFTAFGDTEKKSLVSSGGAAESGLIVEWDEASETLMCAGDTDHIRVWDMTKELYNDFQTSVKSCVTSLSTHGNLTVAGFGDGTVKLFDFRRSNLPVGLLNSINSGLANQHNMFVLKVKIHKPSGRLITSSTLGDVNIFDLRNMQNCLKTPINNEIVTAVEVHPINELIAV